MARGLILSLLVIASSGIAASFFGDVRVAAVIQVIGLLPAIGGLSNPKFVMFEKQVDFSRVALIEVLTRFVSVVTTIAAAITLKSYWALVVGALVATIVRAAMCYGMQPYLPRLCLVHAKRIFAFTGWLSLANALNSISSTLDNLIVARFLGVRDVGLYNMTRQITALPNDGFLAPLERVLFAGFSEIAADAGRLATKVLEVVGILASVAVPFTVGLAYTAPEFVPLVLGEQWIACVPFLQIVLPFFAISMVVTSATPAAMAAGATHQVFRTALYFGVLRLPIFIAGVAWYGLIGAMYALALVSVLWWICNFYLLNKTVSISLRQLVIAVHRQLISAVVMAGAMASASMFFDAAPYSWTLLVAKVVLGVIAYTTTHTMLWFLEGQPPGIETRVSQLLRGLRRVSFAKA